MNTPPNTQNTTKPVTPGQGAGNPQYGQKPGYNPQDAGGVDSTGRPGNAYGADKSNDLGAPQKRPQDEANDSAKDDGSCGSDKSGTKTNAA